MYSPSSEIKHEIFQKITQNNHFQYEARRDFQSRNSKQPAIYSPLSRIS